MNIHKKDTLFSQKLERIREELSLAELSGISNSEYTSLLSKQNKELLSLVENSVSFDSKVVPLSSLFEVLVLIVSDPVCIFDPAMEIMHQNSSWIELFGNTRSLQQLSSLLHTKEKGKLKDAIQKAEQELKEKIVSLSFNKSNYIARILPLRAVNCSISFLMTLVKVDSIKSKAYLNSTFPVDNLLLEDKAVHYSDADLEIAGIYKPLIDAIDGFYFVADNSLIIKNISSTVLQKLGFSAEELTGRSFKNILAQSYIDDLDKLLGTDFIQIDSTKNANEKAIEVLLKDKKGRLHAFDLLLTNYNDPGNANDLLLGLCIDIQKKKAREKELEVARKNAEENDRAKSDFLANMSHEIRTPLNGIIGFSTMLDRMDLTVEKREKYLRIIHSSTRQLLAMVNDIIDISKIEAGKLKIEYRKADLHQLLDDLYTIYNEEKQQTFKDAILLKKSFDSKKDKFFIKTDEVRLKQVISNLLNNALKFTEKGEIVFGYTIEEAGNQLQFFVRDTGPGIPKSKQSLIFRRYRQTREGEKTKYKGTGLGLAISMGIVKLMGSKIEVNSQSGKGSEFYFTIPLKNDNNHNEVR
jgi:PAS domain S-box-containing protein